MVPGGSAVIYKMVRNEDGSPNWIGIGILISVFLVVFVWRCCVFVPEYTVAVRKRFNRVVRDKDGQPREYDPLAEHPSKSGKKVRSFRFRFYLVNSLHMVDCGDRETPLPIKTITFADVDFDTSMKILWSVSRKPGCPTKSFLKPAGSNWSWQGRKNELESLVVDKATDAILKAYRTLGRSVDSAPTELPMLTVESTELSQVVADLLDKYGVTFDGLLYGEDSVSPARRDLEGRLAIAASNDKVAKAHDNIAAAIQGKLDASSESEDEEGTRDSKVIEFPLSAEA